MSIVNGAVNDHEVRRRKLEKRLVPALLLALGATLTVALTPAVLATEERHAAYSAKFKDTYNVENVAINRFVFAVTLSDGTRLECKKPSLEQIDNREPVKCHAGAFDFSPVTLTAK